MEQVFINLAIILLTAFIVAYIARLLKQPIIIGYIIAGILVGPFIWDFHASSDLITIFSEFGIAFLLFMVGLHLNPKVIKEIGGSSLLIGLGQIISIFILGFFVSWKILSYNMVSSIYVGLVLSFSSTIIVMKLLSDKQHFDTLYGKIAIGVLIVQDLVAVGALMVISSLSKGELTFGDLALKSLMSGIGLLIVLFILGFYFLPKFTRNLAKSQELLFLFSVCWCFVIAAAFILAGFSLEIGALVAGVALSISPYSAEISAKIKPLRDFFLIIFFIILGLNINLTNFTNAIWDAVILSALVLIFKPLILMSFMALVGYTKRTNFLLGTTLAQISEFSLIVLTLGVVMEHVGKELVSVITLTALTTITISTYGIIYSEKFYNLVKNKITIFERKNIKKISIKKKKYNAILFGYNRIGFNILRSLKELKKKYLVIDYNPETISSLEKFRVPSLYGDSSDSDFLEDLPLNSIELAISTIPDFETNQLLIEKIREVNKKAIIVARAHQISDALDLYKKGATYVLTPHFLGGEYVAKMVRELKTNRGKYNEERKKHMQTLLERGNKGQEHPDIERD